METGIHNTSEIGRLRKVLLHRPGGELENLMPEYLERLLFDDIPYLREAQREHDAFADCLRQAGVEVVYLRDLVAERSPFDDNADFVRPCQCKTEAIAAGSALNYISVFLNSI